MTSGPKVNFARARSKARADPESEGLDGKTYEKRRMEAVLCGAVVPFVTFASLVWLHTFEYHYFPVLVRTLTWLLAQFCVVAVLPAGIREPTFEDFWPLVSAVLAIGCGVGFGMLNGIQLKPWLRFSSLTEYAHVAADMPSSLPLADAAFISFAASTMLDVNHSAGYFTGGYRYCVAPVINLERTAEPNEIIFWAVGVDCCDPRGDFWCADAKDPDCKSALIHEVSPWHMLFGTRELERYKNAAKMAASEYHFPFPIHDKDQVWLDWVSDPKSAALRHWRSAVITCQLLVVFGALFFSVVGMSRVLALRGTSLPLDDTPKAVTDG